jgi:hypothetical protein
LLSHFVLKTFVLLPFSIASVLTAFALPHDTERYTLVASPATATIAAATTQAVSIRDPEAHCETQVHCQRIDATTLPMHGAAWLYSAPGAPSTETSSLVHPIATRALAFVAHPHRDLGNLTRAQIADLMSGKLANWRELGGPSAPIRFLRTSDPDDVDTLRRFVGAQGAPEQPAPNTFYGDHRCERLVGGDPFAIGTMSLTAAIEAVAAGSPLRVIAIDGIEPCANTLDSGCYPLVHTLMFQVAHPDDHRGDQILTFLRSEQGEAALTSAGYERIRREE